MEDAKINRTKILNLRLTATEYDKLQQRFKKTTQRKFSDFARAMLMGKPQIEGYRDLSMDAMMTEFSALRKDLNGIANNVNQVVHKLHVIDDPRQFPAWLKHYESEHLKLLETMESIRLQVNKIAGKWLQ